MLSPPGSGNGPTKTKHKNVLDLGLGGGVLSTAHSDSCVVRSVGIVPITVFGHSREGDVRTILLLRNISAVLFIAAALGAGTNAKAAPRVCGPLYLTWQLNGCPSQEECMIETVTTAANNSGAGNGCGDTCSTGCGSNWIYGSLYRSNNCNVGGSGWYDSGTVGCYCETTPGGGGF